MSRLIASMDMVAPCRIGEGEAVALCYSARPVRNRLPPVRRCRRLRTAAPLEMAARWNLSCRIQSTPQHAVG